MFCLSSSISTNSIKTGEQSQNQRLSSIPLQEAHQGIYGNGTMDARELKMSSFSLSTQQNEGCTEFRQFPVNVLSAAGTSSLTTPSTLAATHAPVISETSGVACTFPVAANYNFTGVSQVMPAPLTNYLGDMGSNSSSKAKGRSESDTKTVRKRKASNADPCSEKAKQTKVENLSGGAQERTRNPTTWKRNVAKLNRNSGKEYVSAKGRTIPEKVFNPDPHCCNLAPNQKHCCQYQKMPEEERRAIFYEFYQMADYNMQNSLLFGLISKLERKRVRKKKVDGEKIPVASRRSFTFKYKLRRANGVEVPVCKVAFTRVFAINQKRVQTVRHDRKGVAEHVSKFCPPMDMRGKHSNHKTVPEEERERIRRHIESLRVYLPAKRKGSYQVITAAKSIAEMYRLYCDECEKEMREFPKEYLYRDIFNKEYTIIFQSTLANS